MLEGEDWSVQGTISYIDDRLRHRTFSWLYTAILAYLYIFNITVNTIALSIQICSKLITLMSIIAFTSQYKN